MTGNAAPIDPLHRVLQDVDAAHPTQPGVALRPADLDRLLFVRRRRTAVRLGLAATLVVALGLWFGRPAPVAAAPSAADAAAVLRLQAQFRVLDRLAAESRPLPPPAARDARARSLERSLERAAAACRDFAEALQPIDPAAAFRQDQALRRHFPDTLAAARQPLPAPQTPIPQEHR